MAAILAVLLCASAAGAIVIASGAHKDFCDAGKYTAKWNSDLFRDIMSKIDFRNLGQFRDAASRGNNLKMLTKDVSKYSNLSHGSKELTRPYAEQYDQVIAQQKKMLAEISSRLRDGTVIQDVAAMRRLTDGWNHEYANYWKLLDRTHKEADPRYAKFMADIADMKQCLASSYGVDKMKSDNKLKEPFQRGYLPWPPKIDDFPKARIPALYGFTWMEDNARVRGEVLAAAQKMDPFIKDVMAPAIARDHKLTVLAFVRNANLANEMTISRIENMKRKLSESNAQNAFASGMCDAVKSAMERDEGTCEIVGTLIKTYDAGDRYQQENFIQGHLQEFRDLVARRGPQYNTPMGPQQLIEHVFMAYGRSLTRAWGAAIESSAKGASIKDFSEEAAAVVKRNADIYFGAMQTFSFGDLGPIPAFVSGMDKFSSLQKLSASSKYQALVEGDRKLLDPYIKAYDAMIDRHIAQMKTMKETAGDGTVRNDTILAAQARREWQQSAMSGLGEMAKEFRGTAQIMQQRYMRDTQEVSVQRFEKDWSRLSEKNLLKPSFKSRDLRWPPRKEDIRRVNLGTIYGIPFIGDEGKPNETMLQLCEKLDDFVEKVLLPATAHDHADTVLAFLKKNWQANEDVLAASNEVIKLLNGGDAKKYLIFGLYDKMHDAMDNYKKIFLLMRSELDRGGKAYNESAKFFGQDNVKLLAQKKTLHYSAPTGRQKTITDTLMAYCNAMVHRWELAVEGEMQGW